MTSPTDAPPPALGPDPSSRCPDCGRQLAAGHDVDCAAIGARIVRERFSKPDAPPPALGELARRAQAVIEARKASVAEWDRRPNGPEWDAAGRRYQQAYVAFQAVAAPEVVLQLVALAAGGDEAIMEAIELTIKACDAHEKKRVPMEARDVDYAGILAKAKHITARKAARSLTPETPADA